MNSSTNSLSHQFWREKTGKITILNLYMNQTQSLLVTENKKNEFWRELLPKSRNSFYITDSQKRPYRDAKVMKLEDFWCENVVGIGLYNECVLWWGVRFERLLAALKSKRHKHKVASFLAQAYVGRLN